MQIKKILIITLSNIGDVLLTIPSINCILANFPEAKVHIISSPRGIKVLLPHGNITKIISYKKHASLKEKCAFFFDLKKEHYDMVVDFKNSLLPLLLHTSYATSSLKRAPSSIKHMSQRHLWKLATISHVPIDTTTTNKTFHIPKKIKNSAQQLISTFIETPSSIEYLVIAPGARSDIKKWPTEKFIQLSKGIVDNLKLKIIFVGDKNDESTVHDISKHLPKDTFINLAGKTSLHELAYILENAKILISNDSAIMHLGWLTDTMVISIFGPTDSTKYAPLGTQHKIMKSNLSCSPCENAQCKFHHHNCMHEIDPAQILKHIHYVLKEKKK